MREGVVVFPKSSGDKCSTCGLCAVSYITMSVAEHVDAYMKGGGAPGTEAVRALTTLVQGVGGIMPLVTALGPALTDPDERKRGRGMSCLAEVLHSLPPEYIAPDPLAHLLTFFSDRLTDYPTLAPVLLGLRALAVAPLTAEQALAVALALAERCDIRSLVQAERHSALELALALVDRHWEALAPQGCRVLLSFLRAIDGEKDPRNLLLFLKLMRELCIRCAGQELDGFDEAASETFEALSCYFPISFTPPPNDPHQISSAHLLEALLRVLRSCTVFAPLAFPFFITKLRDAEEDEASTKMQALQALALLGKAYGGAYLSPHAEALGEALADLVGSHQPHPGPAGDASCSSDLALRAALEQTLRTLLSLPLAPASAQVLIAPLLGRACTAQPAGPGAEVGGALVRVVVHSSGVAAALVAHQAFPALTRRVAASASPHPERTDALSLMLRLMRALSDPPEEVHQKPATTGSSEVRPAEVATAEGPTARRCALESGAVRAEVLSHARKVLDVLCGCVRAEEEWEVEPAFRGDAGQVICLLHAVPLVPIEPDGPALTVTPTDKLPHDAAASGVPELATQPAADAQLDELAEMLEPSLGCLRSILVSGCSEAGPEPSPRSAAAVAFVAAEVGKLRTVVATALQRGEMEQEGAAGGQLARQLAAGLDQVAASPHSSPTCSISPQPTTNLPPPPPPPPPPRPAPPRPAPRQSPPQSPIPTFQRSAPMLRHLARTGR